MTRRRCLRIAAGMASAGLITMWMADAVWAQDLGGPVKLVGSGTSSIMGELTTWQDEMAAAAAPTDVQYFAVGTLDGRDKFLRGDSDFVISAPPFTPEQLAAQPAGSAEILTIPISVNAPAVAGVTLGVHCVR